MFQDKPLVTIAMMTFNQEKYVRDSVRGILAQTYDPVEIIISDDCSTDRTWQILALEIDLYRRNGGIHSKIYVHRNDVNLGVAKNFEGIISHAHGEIIICQAGDDISLPNRAEVIVESYLKNPAATVFCHEATCIDQDNKERTRSNMRTSAFMPLGALMAYSRKVFTEFGPVEESDAWEDDIYARRAQMLGDEIQIPQPLLKYRVGCSGISSGSDDKKVRRTRVSRGCLAAARQSRRDLEFIKDKLSNTQYEVIKKLIDKHEQFYQNEYNMYNAATWIGRFKAFNRIYLGVNPCLYIYKFINTVAPRWCAILFLPATKLAQFVFRR